MIKVTKTGGYFRAEACGITGDQHSHLAEACGITGDQHSHLAEALKSLCDRLYKRANVLESLPGDLVTDKAREQLRDLRALLG